MAIAAAAEALIERVEPNCAIENVASQARAGRLGQPRALLAEQEADPARHLGGLEVQRAGQVVDAPAAATGPPGCVAEVRRQVGDVLVVRTCW